MKTNDQKTLLYQSFRIYGDFNVTIYKSEDYFYTNLNFFLHLNAKYWNNTKKSFVILQVSNEPELIIAIQTVTTTKKDEFCFIEVLCHKDDTSKELLEWGSRVSAANGRPPTTFS